MDPLKIEDEKFRFSFEDEMDPLRNEEDTEMDPLKIEDEMVPLRNEEDTMDLIMEMSKKRQVGGIDLRNWPPRELGLRRPAPWGGSGIDLRFSFEDEMVPLRNEDTIDLIMEISKKRQVGGIDLRNWPPRELGLRRPAPWVGSGIDLLYNAMMPEMLKEKTKTKKAVLIGLKHPRINNNTDDDVKEKTLRMKVKLMELRGFTEDNITLMIDQDQQEPIRNSLQPTKCNILRTLSSLLHSAGRGDILYIHLIAYGCSGGQIITSDKLHIRESFFRGLIVAAYVHGYNLTLVSDCLIEPAACSCQEKRLPPFPPLGPYTSLEETRKMLREFFMNREVFSKCLQPTNLSYVDILNTPNEEKKKDDDDDDDSYSGVILMTLFRPVQNAATIPNVYELFIPAPNRLTEHTSYGVFTNAILDVMEETHGQVSNLELAQKAIKKLERGMIPTLGCSDHNLAYTSFLC